MYKFTWKKNKNNIINSFLKENEKNIRNFFKLGILKFLPDI